MRCTTAEIPKYLVTCAALTLATLATRVVSVTEDQSQNWTNVICEQIKVANSSYEGHSESFKLAYPEGCPSFKTKVKLFKRKCPFTGKLDEEMKYQQLNRSLYSFTNTFTSLLDVRNPSIMQLDSKKEGSVRIELLKTVLTNLRSLQREVNETTGSWNNTAYNKNVPPCYELEEPARLHTDNIGQMCTVELKLFDAYHTLLRRAHKAFCPGQGQGQGQGMARRRMNGRRNEVGKVRPNRPRPNKGKNTRHPGRKGNKKVTEEGGRGIRGKLKGKGPKWQNKDVAVKKPLGGLRQRRPKTHDVPQNKKQISNKKKHRRKLQQMGKIPHQPFQ